MSEKGTVLDEHSVTLDNWHEVHSKLPHNLRRIKFDGFVWTLSPPLPSVVPLRIAGRPVIAGPTFSYAEKPSFQVMAPPRDPLPQVNLDPHEWVPEETVALIAKHLPQEAANLLFLTNGDLIAVLNREFSENELEMLPEFICGRKIRFTSKVGIRPSVGTGVQEEGSVGGKAGRHIVPGEEILWRGPLYDPKTPFSKAQASQLRPSAAGVVVQLANGNRLLTVTTHGYAIPNSMAWQEQGAVRRFFGGSREGQLVFATDMSSVSPAQTDLFPSVP